MKTKTAFLLFSLFAVIALNSQQVRSFDKSNGLSQSIINCIEQDENGFMWFGTQDGLNRYDAYSFIAVNSLNGLENSNINSSLFDDQGNFWVGTEQGLFKRDKGKTQFKKISFTKKSNIPVVSLYLDNENNLWIGTRQNGLFRYTVSSKKSVFIACKLTGDDGTKQSIHCLLQYEKYMLAGTDSGLFRIEISSARTKRFLPHKSIAKPPWSTLINCMVADGKNVWLGTYGAGIYKFDGSEVIRDQQLANAVFLSEGVINCLTISNSRVLWIGTQQGLASVNLNNSEIKYPLPIPFGTEGSGNIRSLFIDRDENIWAGAWGALWFIPGNQKPFDIFIPNPQLPSNDAANSVTALAEDLNGKIWIGTDNGGLISDKHEKAEYITFPTIMAVGVDAKNRLWISPWGDGIYVGNSRENLFQIKNPFPEKIISDNVVRSFCFSGDSLVIIGTEEGVDLYDLKNDRLIPSPEWVKSLAKGRISFVYLDVFGLLWVGTAEGLKKISLKKSEKLDFPAESDKLLHNRNLKSFVRDKYGKYWVGTSGGLVILSSKGEILKKLDTDSGLPNNVIYSVLEGNDNQIWCSTNKGLVRIDPVNYKISVFNKNDGLPDDEFNSGAALKSKDGKIYFGSIKGLCHFDPLKIHVDSTAIPVHIRSLKVFNKDLLPEKEVITGESVTLNYSDKFITIEFGALSFVNPEEINYAYRLEGFDTTWIESSTMRVATYTNLDPGTYTFTVIACNHDGVWNQKGASITIVVTTPFYRTWTFRFIILAFAFIILISINMIRIRMIRRRNRDLAKKVVERTENYRVQKKKAEEAGEQLRQEMIARNRFFNIMTHDIKNPVWGIEELAREAESNPQAVQKLKTTTTGLKKLLENLLTWASLQSGRAAPRFEITSVFGMADEAIDNTEAQASAKNIKILNNTDPEILVNVDRQMIIAVFRNLISNAIKFSFPGSEVNITTKTDKNLVEIFFTDKGTGMEKEYVDRLFSLEHTNVRKGTGDEKGTGLGLLICKELVEKNHGTINAQSQLGNGSTITIRFDVVISP